MTDIAITKMSSKGQIVIPSEMRKGFREGDKFMIIKSDDRILLKKTKDIDKNLEEDLIFAKRTEEALKKYEKGEFKKMNFDDFLNEVKKW
jgi:AbrB family looped-hinge helix DNA binding protein